MKYFINYFCNVINSKKQMKKLLLLFVIAGLVITACGPSAEELEAQRIADSTKMADSLAKVQAENQRIADSTAKAQAIADSIAKAAEKGAKKGGKKAKK
jgi:cytochrome c-type biogenesis protein CcmH/NrfF